jgi:imidazolonepropionase-like amidohydrolase
MPDLAERRRARLRRGAPALAVACALALAAARALRPPPLPRPPPPGLALSGLTLVQPGEGRRTGVTLSAAGDRIEAIDHRERPGASDAFAGRFALPGLVDLHVHHPPSFALGQRELFALLFLAHGVTSVRDTGAFGSGLPAHAARIARGEIPGPRVFACGPILDGARSTWPRARVLRDPAEARRAVEDLAAAGADCVKLYNELDDETFLAAAQAAAERGLPVVAHVPWTMPFQRVAGVEVQHLMGLADDWLAPLPEAAIERYAAHSARAGLAHTPTLVTYARAARLDHPLAFAADPSAQLLPRFYRARLWAPDGNPLVAWLVPGGAPEARARIARMREVVGRLHAAGVRVLAGSDTPNPGVVPGAALREELSQLASAGLEPDEALAAATSRAGEALRASGLGRLEPGAPADLGLYREDPTRDLAALATLEAVVAGGRLYTVEDLLAAAGARRAHADRQPWAVAADLAARGVVAAARRAER